jgi:2,5-diketo-D-gluconate reductase A
MNSEQPFIELSDQIRIPQVGLGVWQASQDQARRAVSHALSVGYRHVDTAAIYANEEGVGAGLRDAGLDRADVFVTTKIWNSAQGLKEAAVALDESLARLQLKYVDLLLIHWPCPDKNQYVDTWRALIKAKEQGKVRSIGVSNFNDTHLKHLIDETGVAPSLNQIELHPFFQQQALRRAHDELNIHTESWSPLGQGQALGNEVIGEIAAKYQRTPAQVIIRWHIQLGLVAIPKSVTPERISENFQVFDFTLDEADIARIGRLDSNTRMGPNPLDLN